MLYDILTAIWLPYILIAVASIADVFTTLDALKRGGIEANPVVAFLMKHIGSKWVFVKAAVVWVAAYGLYLVSLHFVVTAIAVITGIVAIRNMRVGK